MSALRTFLAFNRALCRLLDRYWAYPLAASFWDDYVRRSTELVRTATVPRLVDVGAGRTTPYADAVPNGHTLVGVDVLEADLEANPGLDERVVRNVITEGLPTEAQGAGVITSRMVIEHIPDLDRFARELATALVPGGSTVHLFAGRHSVFAILNRLLPEEVSRRILFALRPESVEVGGFETHYDRTNASAARRVFEGAGFTDVEIVVSYQVSQYFEFFFPLFLLARVWETALHHLGRQDLGSFVLLTARRD
jgi:2-polyprenyl-6-hydroxyphenyl methylase/3-demethylubiquinone-9 3-methyltransferase